MTAVSTVFDAILSAFGDPVISWSGEVQPRPLQRARIVINPGRAARAFTPDLSVRYRERLQWEWRIARLRQVSGALVVRLSFVGRPFRGGGCGDLDNHVKAVLDAGNGFLWTDDSQIVGIAAEFGEWGKDVTPRVTVEVWRAPDGSST